MNLTRASVLPFVAAVVLSIPLVACSGDASDDEPRGTPRPTLTLPPSSPVPTIVVPNWQSNEVTPAQEQLTEDIVRADPTVQALAGESEFVIEGISLVRSGPGRDQPNVPILGTFGHIRLLNLHDVAAVEIPRIEWRPYYPSWPDDLKSRYRPWDQQTETIGKRNLNSFDFTVDLATREVVHIQISSFGGETEIHPTSDIDDLMQEFADAQERAGDVKEIAENDPVVQAILNALTDEEESFGGHIDPVGDHRFGKYSIYAHQVVKLEGDWPVIVDQDPVTGDYRTEVIPVTGNYGNEVYVTVDMDLGEVIHIDTQEHD